MRLWSIGKANATGLLQGGGVPLAIDFGVSSLKVLHIENPERPALLGAASVATPEQVLEDAEARLEFQVAALPKLLKTARVRAKRAVCAIPAGLMFCKHLQTPRGEGIDLGLVVRSAVSEQLGCHPDALVYMHQEAEGAKPPGGSGKTEVISMAASRRLVERLMGTLRACKLDPVAVHPEFVALSAWHASPAGCGGGIAGSSGAELVLDVGCGTTKVCVFDGGRLSFAKTVLIGGRQMDRHVAERSRRDTAQAHEARLWASSWSGSAETDSGVAVKSSVDVSEILESLTDEVAMCVRYHAALYPGRKVRSCVLAGGESRHGALAEHVGRALRLPVRVADPFDGLLRAGDEAVVGVDLDEPQPGWAVALGLALSPTDL